MVLWPQFLQKNTTLPIGVDIGTHGLRAVQLTTDAVPSIYRCTAWRCEPEQTEELSAETVVRRLERFVNQMEFHGRQCVMGLSTPTIELHPLDLPAARDPAAENEMQKAARWEIHRLTTLDKEALQTGVWMMPASKRYKATMMGVAAPRPEVERLMSLSESAGLECTSIDAAATALATLVWRLRGRPTNQVWGILDLGHIHTRLILCIDGIPVMARTLVLGGRQWTEKVAALLRVSHASAELNKREFGLGSSAALQTTGAQSAGGTVRSVGSRSASAVLDAPPSAAGEELSAMILGVLRDDLLRISLEIERSYEYLLQCYAPFGAGDLVLVGGGALLKGLDEWLAGQLGIRVMPLSQCPTEEARRLSIGLNGSESLEVCALACGLSLQGANDAES